MKKKIFYLFISTMVVLIIFLPILAQEKEVIKCKVKSKELKSVKYYIGNIERVGETLSIRIAVKTNQINETDLVLIAKHIKERFCNETQIVTSIFDAKWTADNFNTTIKSARDALRGEYVLDKGKGEEYISFVKVQNYFENTKNSIRINLPLQSNDKLNKSLKQ